MRTLVLALLLVWPQQTRPVTFPRDAVWVGPLEFTDGRGENIIPTRVTLTFDGDTIAGEWRTLNGKVTGQITGMLDAKRQPKMTVTMFAGAEQVNDAGQTETVAVERCKGEGTFTGKFTAGGVLRVTSKKINMESQLAVAQGRACDSPWRLVWTLQPAL